MDWTCYHCVVGCEGGCTAVNSSGATGAIGDDYYNSGDDGSTKDGTCDNGDLFGIFCVAAAYDVETGEDLLLVT